MYAIRHKETKEWFCGTDFNVYPNVHFKSFNFAVVYEFKIQAETEMACRKLSDDYEVLKVSLKVEEQ